MSVSQLNGSAGRTLRDGGNGTDSMSYQYLFNGSVSGTAMVATYSNLQHSYYVDNNGNRHTISKIVRTFSNLSAQPWMPSWDWNKTDKSYANNGKPVLWVYDDPTDGFWYYYSSGVTVTDQFYDDRGNLINFGNNAWLAVTSLNNQSGGRQDFNVNNAAIEQVTPVSGGQAVALLGSSVSNHGGTLYSDHNNTDGPVGSINDSGSWDAKGPNEYYGSGLIKLLSDPFTLRFSASYDPSYKGPLSVNVWATTTTIIPATPGPTYQGPRRPTPPLPPSPSTPTSANYHYDVTLAK